MDYSTSSLVNSSSQHLSNPFLSSSTIKPSYSINVSQNKTSSKKACIYNSKSIPPTKSWSHINPVLTNIFSSTYTSQQTPKIQKPLHFLNTIFNAIDDLIIQFLDPPPRPSIDPKIVLADNFSPVLCELPPTACEVVQGSIPPCLHGGAYIRNGPNPQFPPLGPHHLFNGDGMLHCIKMDNQGNSTLCSRFVKTNMYLTDLSAGRSIYSNVFTAFNGLAPSVARVALFMARVITKQFDLSKGLGLANTNVVSLFTPGNLLLATAESDLPYEVRITPDGDIITLGRHDFDGQLERNMTSHPKTDPDTGEVFAFKYGATSPFLTYFRFSREGEKEPDVPIWAMLGPSFFHDFAITKKYAIFADTQIGIKPNLTLDILLSGGSLVGPDQRKVPRIGVLPRYAKDDSEMKWLDVPGFNNLHVTNAWDEDDGDSIVLIAPNILTLEHILEQWDGIYLVMEKMKINLKTGVISRQSLSRMNLEYGVINPAYLCKKTKYVYAGVNSPAPKMGGVVKLDISMAEQDGEDHNCVVGRRMYGHGCYGGEAYFVAKEPENPNAEEDDGYLMSFVHNEISDESTFLIMDAKSPTLELVAELKLPRRVPYGFHGLFVRGKDLFKL